MMATRWEILLGMIGFHLHFLAAENVTKLVHAVSGAVRSRLLLYFRRTPVDC